MGDVETKKSWIQVELDKAREEYKANKGKNSAKYQAAVNKIDALNHIIYWSKADRDNYLTSNQMKLSAFNKNLNEARKECKEIEWMLKGKRSDQYNKKEYDIKTKWVKQYQQEQKGNVDYKGVTSDMPDGGFKEWLLKKRNEAAKKMKEAKTSIAKYNNYQEQIKFANEMVAKHGQPKKGARTATTPTNVEDNVETGTNSKGNGKVNAGGTPKYTEGQAYEKDGAMVIPLLDKDGNQVGYKFKDQNGKDQVLMNDEIHKTSVKLDDVKKALETGDIKKALELLLQALMDKSNSNVMSERGNGVGNGVGASGVTEPVITEDPYTDKNGVVFKVIKKDNVIEAIAQGDVVFNRAEFDKANIKPEDVEQALKNKDFKKAGELIFDVSAANGRLQPEIKVDKQTGKITLFDAKNQKFELDEKKLQEFGLKKGKAEKAMENLRALGESAKTNSRAAYIVASYFAKEQPAPTMPETQAALGTPKLNRNPGGKIISITVKDASGNEKELGYKDFAKAFDCSDDEAKKIRKECIRAIKNKGNVNEVLGFVAAKSEGKAKFWTNSTTKIGTYTLAGAAAAFGVSELTGITHVLSGGKDDSSDTTTTATTASAEKVTVAAAATTDATDTTNTTEEAPKKSVKGLGEAEISTVVKDAFLKSKTNSY